MQRQLRLALICQVRDQADLVPIFLANHTRLFEKIILLDHLSKIDLRGISIPGVDVIRIEARPYLQQVYPNFAIRKLSLQSKFDWLFALDIDELLLSDQKNLKALLEERRQSPYVKMNWKNGSFSNHAEDKDLKIWRFKKYSSHRKVAVNLRRIGHFNFIHGYHGVKYSRLTKLNPFTSRSRDLPLPISHMPLGLGRDFEAKANLDSFPSGKFREKITRTAPQKYLEAIERITKGEDDSFDRLYISAFYREDGKEIPDSITEDMFDTIKLEHFLDRGVLQMTRDFFRSATNGEEPNSGKIAEFTVAENHLLNIARKRLNHYTSEMERLLEYDAEHKLIRLAQKT